LLLSYFFFLLVFIFSIFISLLLAYFFFLLVFIFSISFYFLIFYHLLFSEYFYSLNSADAASPASELRLLAGAQHQIRDDPRTVALLIGWLERMGTPAVGD